MAAFQPVAQRTLAQCTRRAPVSIRTLTGAASCQSYRHPHQANQHGITSATQSTARELQKATLHTTTKTDSEFTGRPAPANQHGVSSGTQQTAKDLKHAAAVREEHPGLSKEEAKPENIAPGVNKTFKRFDLSGTAIIVTGGGQGLGLAMAEGCAEGGARVYCLDRNAEPGEHFKVARDRLLPYDGGKLEYRQVDITDTKSLDEAITKIADDHQRLDGVIAAAGIQKISPAIEYSVEDAKKMLDVNFTGVLMTATAAARQMMKYKCQGSICLVASMSGLIANKGLISPVYNASKAAVIQLARSLSMEWAKLEDDGVGGIRVNALSPGHIVTPMVRKNFEEVEGLRQTWEAENMMGRISEPEEFKGAGLFLLSKASSFMTGNNLVLDGGHTAW